VPEDARRRYGRLVRCPARSDGARGCARSNGEIYAGHRRWEVLKQLWDKPTVAWRRAAGDAGIAPGTVPAVVADVPERLAWERGMRDNAQWGDYDDALLLAHMQRIADAGSDMKLLGFDEEALSSFFPDGEPEGDEESLGGDETPEVPVVPTVQPGDVWVLGRHRIACIDSSDPEALFTLLAESRRVDAIVTDPPYGMSLDTDWSDIQSRGLALDPGVSLKRSNPTTGNKYDRVIGDDESFDASWLFERFSVEEVFLFGADYYVESLPNFGHGGAWMVWDKRKESQSEAIGSEFELIWSKSKHKRRVLRHDWFGFLSSENAAEAQDRVHPTQKPTSLMRDIIEQWVDEGAVVLDPYAGSGTTLIACEQTGRVCMASEIDPKYCDVIIQRWQDLTNEDAVRAGDGITFSEAVRLKLN
jgi:DNA modification methylase